MRRRVQAAEDAGSEAQKVLHVMSAEAEASRREQDNLRERVAGVAETDEMKAAIAAEHTVAHYARTSLPEFVEETSMCHTVARVMMEEHGWVSASAWGLFESSAISRTHRS